MITVPLDYFPAQSGRYEVKPGLFTLGKDFGHGQADGYFFQLDTQFAHYIANKRQACAEDKSRYVCFHNIKPATMAAASRFIMDKLLLDYPEHFSRQENQTDITLSCGLTGEELVFDTDCQLVSTDRHYQNAFDALAMQIQEDLALVQLDRNSNDYLAALHLCAPNYWSAQDKIGRPFTAVHQPVAGIENINRRHREIIGAMINKSPFVRFAWGLTTDTRLNHHPVPPHGIDAESWHGRKFNSQSPELYMRVERQCIQGFPEHDAALFSIRTFFSDVTQLKHHSLKREALLSAINSMTRENLVYKGLLDSKKDILLWLET